MPTVVIKGYKLKSCDMREIESAIAELQSKIEIQGKRLYTQLLAEEIQEMTDDIALNVIPRPDISIYDAAVNALDFRISNATGRNLPLRFNLGVQAAIFTLKDETYIKLNMQNEAFAKLIKPPAPLTEFSLYDEQTENKDNAKRGEIWNEISEIYTGNNNPMIKQLFPTSALHPEWKKIADKFNSREDRARVRVRRQLTSQLLNAIGMGQEIPPHKLLPYLDEALEMLGNDGIHTDAERMQQQILQSIINITEEETKRDPKAPVAKTFEEPAPKVNS